MTGRSSMPTRKVGAPVVVAKLDCLSRDVAYIAGLMKSRVPLSSRSALDERVECWPELALTARFGDHEFLSKRLCGALCGCGICDHGHLSTHQISGQGWQSLVVALGPSILYADVLSLDVASFSQPTPQCRPSVRIGLGVEAGIEPKSLELA
jgi:hypothetical protein